MPPLLSKELLQEWNEKLKKSGIKDIEVPHPKTGEMILNYWDAHYFTGLGHVELFEIKQEYYYQAHHFLNSHKFKSQTERHIWEMHANGFGLRCIAKSLIGAGIKTNKDYVAIILNKLKRALKEAIKCANETLLD